MKKLIFSLVLLLVPFISFGATLAQCTNGLDDNSNHLIDLQDPECSQFRPICVPPQTINPVGTLPSNWCINPAPVDPVCVLPEVLVNHVCVLPEPVDPVCVLPEVLTDHLCVIPTPVDPTCQLPQILENHVCVTPPVEPPVSPPVAPPSHSSGGGGGMIWCSGEMAPGYVHGLDYGGCENLKPKDLGGNPLQLQLIDALQKLIQLLNELLKLK